MSDETALAISQPVKASDQLASFLGIEKGMMLETLKAQCFKGKRPDEVSDAQLAAFVSTANALQVNPLLPGFLYAYPERNGGITPILGPDGVMKKLDELIVSGKLRGYECEVKMGADGKPESATAIIHRAGDSVSAKYTAYFSEWVVPSNPNWASRPRHMIWVRAIKQAARQVIHGLPMDTDEYEIAKMQNVTPGAEEPAAVRPTPKPRSVKGAAAVQENTKPVQTVEAEIVPEAAPAPVAPIPVAPPKVETFAQAAEASEPVPDPVPTPPAPTADPAPTSNTAAPRAFLNDGESVSVIVRVTELKAGAFVVDGVSTPGVKAKVSGGYVGEVRHIGGAKAVVVGSATTYEALPPWTLKAEVGLILLGKKNSKGTVEAYVQTAEAVPEEF